MRWQAGRGSENKIPFVAAVQTTDSGQPHSACLSQSPFTKESMQEFMACSLLSPLTVVSDGLGCFTAIAGEGVVYERTVTGGGKASVELPQFKAVNTLMGNLKTALTGTCHAVNFAKYAQRYLSEMQYKFSRRYDLHAILPRLARAAAAPLLLPERVVRCGAVHR